jgi:hypothetical protein
LCPVEDHPKWMKFYPDTSEEIPKNLLPEKGPRVSMTVYVDAEHAHDLVTRRPITGILFMINNRPIRWIESFKNHPFSRKNGTSIIDQNMRNNKILST